jgi:hypothetical protein
MDGVSGEVDEKGHHFDRRMAIFDQKCGGECAHASVPALDASDSN